VKVDGPTKTDITRKDLGDKCDISFLPMTPGVYNIIIKYNGKEMKGSPFVSKVSGNLNTHVLARQRSHQSLL
jgi:filamin